MLNLFAGNFQMDNCLDFRTFVSHEFPFSWLVFPGFGFGCSFAFCPLAFCYTQVLPNSIQFLFSPPKLCFCVEPELNRQPNGNLLILFFGRFSLCFRFWGNKKPARNTGEIMKMKQNQCFRPLNVSSVAMLDMSGNPTVCGDDGKCREIQQVEKLFKKCGEMEIERK